MSAEFKAAAVVATVTVVVLSVGFYFAPVYTASALGYGIGAVIFRKVRGR